METVNEDITPVNQAADIQHAEEKVRALARSVGFAEQEIEELALVIRELGTNLIKHADGGVLAHRLVLDGKREGLVIESRDHGPGIVNVEHAIGDGVSTANSLGYGLGTVNRLMDEMEVHSKRGLDHGTQVICRKWLRKNVSGEIPCPLDIGVATRPYPGLKVNGDAYVLKKWGQRALVAVIDGLGHGPHAHQAARMAKSYIEAHYDLPFVDLFRGTHRACQGSRGVVMATARFDCVARTVELAGIGNIETRLYNTNRPIRPVIRRGVIGGNAPSPLVTTHPWSPGALAILHSDGLSTHWHLDTYAHLAGTAATLANGLLQACRSKVVMSPPDKIEMSP